KTGTTGQASLTNHKPESPSESTTLATPLIIYCTSFVSFSGWLLIFLACHYNAERHRIVCALRRRYSVSKSHTGSHDNYKIKKSC
uniref:Glycoprotein N n=1 Tax=Mesocestoides corti TaxID=53468 RepID=A0A5K3EWL1_MESCO